MFPARAQLFDARGPYLIPLVLLVLSRAVMWAWLPLASEDAYITFRFARNFAHGLGPVYNVGERVMGFSSPLWMAWSAVGIRLFGDPVPWARGTALLADGISLVLLGHLLERHASRTAARCFTGFFAGWPYFAAVSMSGMESSAMLALLALSAATLGAPGGAAGAWLGALALMRPEGIASAAVLALGARPRQRLIALVLVLMGYGALTLEFGTPIAQSVLAKSRLYGTPGPWRAAFWWDWIVPFQFGRWPDVGELSQLFPLTVVFAPACVAGLAALWNLRRSPLALATAAGLVVWLGYAALGVAYFHWYLCVPLAALALAASVGLPRIATGRALYVSIALYVLGTWTLAPTLYVGRAAGEAVSFDRAATYLRAHAVAGERAMLEPIGLVGWRAPVRVIDEIGLVSPRVAARRLAGPGWYADVARSERPEWLVVRVGMLQEGVAFAGRGAPFRNAAERDSLLARYHIADHGIEDAGDQALAILRRFR